MTIFAIMAGPDPTPELESDIAKQYPGDAAYRFGQHVWFVVDSGTARSVSEKLNITKGGTHSGVVVMPMANSYYGYAATTLWDWLKAKIEAPSNG